jgi:hypothetical protein
MTQACMHLIINKNDLVEILRCNTRKVKTISNLEMVDNYKKHKTHIDP